MRTSGHAKDRRLSACHARALKACITAMRELIIKNDYTCARRDEEALDLFRL